MPERPSSSPDILPRDLFTTKSARQAYIDSEQFVQRSNYELAAAIHTIGLPQAVLRQIRLNDLPRVITRSIPFLGDEEEKDFHDRIDRTKQKIENAISRARANKQQMQIVPLTDEWNMQFQLTKRGKLEGVWFVVRNTKEMEQYERELEKQKMLQSIIDYELSREKAEVTIDKGVKGDYRFAGDNVRFRSHPYGVQIHREDIEQLIEQCPGYELVLPENADSISQNYSAGKRKNDDRENTEQIFLRPVTKVVEGEQPQQPVTDYVLKVLLTDGGMETSLHLSHAQIEKNRAAFIEKETAIMKEFIDRKKDAARKNPGSSEDISPSHAVYARINHLGQRRRNGIDWIQSVYKDLMPEAQKLALSGAPLEVWEGIERFLDARDGKKDQPNYVYHPFGVMSMRTNENWSVSFIENPETGKVEVKLIFSTQRA